MLCPFCNHTETKVVDSRDTQEGRAIRRRRECEKCHARFSTYEEIEIFHLLIVKKDGHKEEYDREKIEKGLRRAFEKRPSAEEKIEKILGEIEYALHEKHMSEIQSKEIGTLVMEKLKEADQVAYIRFISVYKSFGSAKSFRKALETLE
ncbi:MAG: transcriptional repressor NrdR [Candidatus Moranbacteria bacterium]|nr:transcriptional repressor NrdR [Candidatus Moranbacteria bacterium]OIQ02733.1 MAG: transcriptional regulator NrdR [Candidatus Moranbacteria bacterium CG2_30_41_165]PIP25803.1 MAG: transcriptional regulator NrdR [Candidatus Moranbacteria bacterium CG23_combo_of_CG06-09_8_20_14_all_41_28]PIV86504.1 MAG: transcriptional regulator NrdR [Candidatus Moranbacteria bacterium CG17_big_fil_post_rev_8_21_14_2_50_41_107]PIW93696.1 MAG: transcriptional regulator NrdR [Candidatus Moranbacteria bacterium C